VLVEAVGDLEADHAIGAGAGAGRRGAPHGSEGRRGAIPCRGGRVKTVPPDQAEQEGGAGDVARE
jgi:hypothetical protein